ncbi:MAG: thiamine phosphate synthase [Gammaproteobacteria bacterium]
MTLQLDRFYPIVEDAAWVERLVRLGARLIQLRMKEKSLDEVRTHVRVARLACERSGAQLVVNDYWQIAIEEACDFVHLGQEDLDGADLAAIRRAGIRLGVSTHDYAELERALSVQPAYIALGPIYPTRLKKMKWAPQGPFRLVEWKKLIGTIPLVAIGGLTAERLPEVFSAGADIAAVVTDIVASKDPAARTREWVAATRVTATRAAH